jgi:hypothetical protein
MNIKAIGPGTLFTLASTLGWLIVTVSLARLLIGQTRLVSAGFGGPAVVLALIALVLAGLSVRVDEPRYLAVSAMVAVATLAVAVVLIAFGAAHETGVAMAVGASVAAATSLARLRILIRLRAAIEHRSGSADDGRHTS